MRYAGKAIHCFEVRTMRIGTWALVLALAVPVALGAAYSAAPRAGMVASASQHAAERYPLASAAFVRLVDDAYTEAGSDGLPAFAAWIEGAYATSALKLPGYEKLSLSQALVERRRQIQATRNLVERVGLERQTGAWLHRLIKSMIPRFSLDRGFEFAHVVRFGERQCLLQSTLIASLLQAMDIDAGVYMVWTGPRGEVSNNGHAVSVVKLSDGRDLLVDASEAVPFVRHQGLFVAYPTARSYRFVRPVYDDESAITSYRPVALGAPMNPRHLRPLDLGFVRSQFYFYRGERAPGGFLGKPRTAQGLALSARHLERAVQENPHNPLAVYLLGHVYLRQRRVEAAKVQYAKGYALYQAFGYVPDGPKAAYAQAMR